MCQNIKIRLVFINLSKININGISKLPKMFDFWSSCVEIVGGFLFSFRLHVPF